MPVKVSQKLCYSWWTHPEAVLEAGGDRALFGGVMPDGRPRIFRLAPGDDYTTVENHILLSPAPEADDHNSVSILSVEGKPLVAFWQRHGKSVYLNWWRAPEGTLDFAAKQRVAFPAKVSYCQVFHIDGDRSIAFVRADGWYFITTDDHFATVSTPVKLIEGSTGRIYINVQPSTTVPDLYHFVGAQNPASSTPHYLAYGTMNLDTGDVTDGTSVVGNLWTGAGLPLDQTDLFDIAPLDGPDERVRLLDVYEIHGEPVIEYAKWGGGVTSQHFHAHIDGPGSAVKVQLGVLTGAEFGPTAPRHYIGGAVVDREGAGLYIAREAAGTSYLERYEVLTDFTLGAPTLVQSNPTYRLVRPVSFVGGVMWQELRKYTNYLDFESHIWIE